MIKRVVDLSLTTGSFPGKPPYYPPPQYSHWDVLGDEYNRSQLMGYLKVRGYNIGQHESCYDITCTADPLGTHAEVYWLDDRVMFGKLTPAQKWLVRDIPKVPVFQLVGPASVVDMTHIPPDGGVELDDLKKRGSHIQEGDIVFIRTDYGDRMEEARKQHKQEYYSASPGLTVEAAKWLVEEKRIRALAVDTRGPEIENLVWQDISEVAYPVHRIMHNAGAVILEDVGNLCQLKEERFFAVVGIPLKIEQVSGGPARILAVEEKSGRVLSLTRTCSPYPEKAPTKPFGRTEPWQERENIVRRVHIQKIHFRGFGYGYPGDMPDWGEYFTFNSRIGTHIDFPSVEAFENVPAGSLYGDAVIVDLTNSVGMNQPVTTEDLKPYASQIRESSIVMLMTGFSDWNYGIRGNMSLSPWLTEDAAQWLCEQKPSIVVTDFAAPDRVGGSEDRPHSARAALLSAGIPVVSMATNMLFCKKQQMKAAVLPLPFEGIDCAPARVVAIEEYV